MKILTKRLSPNDVGATGSHQVGILVPKIGGYLAFFPRLDPSAKNPSVLIAFTEDSGRKWCFRFVYYNNRKFGGTRNEYRLTRMTRFMRAHHAKAGDGLVLRRDGSTFSVGLVDAPPSQEPRKGAIAAPIVSDVVSPYGRISLVFDDDWNLIEEG
jgi:hypothetical protein